MEKKINCWEFKKCGREESGAQIREFGVCEAATDKRLDGLHDGVNAGRTCWVVSRTLCGGKVQGTYAQKIPNCLECDFYNDVKKGEGKDFLSLPVLFQKLRAGA